MIPQILKDDEGAEYCFFHCQGATLGTKGGVIVFWNSEKGTAVYIDETGNLEMYFQMSGLPAKAKAAGADAVLIHRARGSVTARRNEKMALIRTYVPSLNRQEDCI